MKETPLHAHILLIEDERDMREGLALNLRAEGFEVDTAADGEQGLEKLRDSTPDLLVLDLMLPKVDGHEVLARIREEHLRVPVIVLSARGGSTDKVACLEAGADDYVTKPFGLDELTARIRAVLRRVAASDAHEAGAVHHFPDLVVDFRRFTVARGGQEYQLSRFESEILRMLVDRRGTVVTRKDLLTEVWGYTHLPNTRTVDNHIARLRKKIEANPDRPQHVVTVHGIGYRFESEPLEEPA
ncbi:MAG: response regulator transcription factor [Planctomycetes bacterium]|nr:response regulator transcription factor [Planctomycetota bacterium]